MKSFLIFRNCIIMAVIEFIVCMFCTDDMRTASDYYYESYFDNYYATYSSSSEAWMYIVFPILAIGLLLLIYDFSSIRKCKNIKFLQEKLADKVKNIKKGFESNGIENYDFSELEYLGCTDSTYNYAITIKIPNLDKSEDNYIREGIKIYSAPLSFDAKLKFVLKNAE